MAGDLAFGESTKMMRQGPTLNGLSFADPANLVVIPEAEFESENALGFLQAIYKRGGVPLSVRMRAAIEALPFESPKLSATAVLTSEDFAERLERAIARSGMKASRTINAKPLALALPQPEYPNLRSISSKPRKEYPSARLGA